ncbi:MAG TPA: imidazole glycerol phosphate synthase subunit HisH [Desulfotomaculum sp.]|nr:imidazole glycerol phosphate synthase subunit HisH [Desulfotomaculum sp.]
MIAVIDYGMGNLRSVEKGFVKTGFEAKVVSEPEAVARAAGVVLPGVGAFADAMSNLRSSGLLEVVVRTLESGKPFLGICLGLQLLFEASEEWQETPGLGFFRGRVRRLPEGVKVPHMGWNELILTRPTPLFAGIPDRTRFYFVHSYYADPRDRAVILGETDYGVRFTVAAGRERVFGIQFHPEKSSSWGLQVLANFGKLVTECS